MSGSVIRSIAAIDAPLLLTQKVQQRCRARFPVYAMAWTHPKTEGVRRAWGWRSLWTTAIDWFAKRSAFWRGPLVGDRLRDHGEIWQRGDAELANDPALRLGPHKGVVYPALASISNARWDLWANKHWMSHDTVDTGGISSSDGDRSNLQEHVVFFCARRG